MRDFKANRDIKIDGDVVINDFSHQRYKPLNQCKKEELKEEEAYLKSILENEQNNKSKKALVFITIAALFFLIISSLYMTTGHGSTAMYIIGVLGIVYPAMKAYLIRNTISEFELQQLKTIKEIESLLREK